MSRKAYIVADIGYGDGGKGSVVDFLSGSERAHTVVRYNGGNQAGHNVVTPHGRQHVFSQFGSGSFVPYCETHLSRFVTIHPLAMLYEADHLARMGETEMLRRTTISENALVVTPFHVAANRLRELARGNDRHGSCGMGIGETKADALAKPDLAIHAVDYLNPPVLRAKLRRLQEYKRAQLADVMTACRGIPEAAQEIWLLENVNVADTELQLTERFSAEARIVSDAFLREVLRRPGTVVFEGAQGVLLDEWRGFHPYTTWSSCGFTNALTLLREHEFDGDVTRVGVTRAYATRHGPGPFVTFDRRLTALLPDSHNKMGEWQREFRVGWFDAVALRYALAACDGVDWLAITCCDRMGAIGAWLMCDRYNILPREKDETFFVRDESGLVQDIRLGPDRDLAHQEELTKRLLQAWSHTEIIDVGGTEQECYDQYVQTIANALGTPVRLLSEGPTAMDKRWVNIIPRASMVAA